MPEWEADGRIPEMVPEQSVPPFDYDDLQKGDRIGTGGNADVFYATVSHEGTDYPVALKEPRFDGTIQTQVVNRFVEEAETWASLDDHENIVSVYAWDDQPLPWLGLEYMDGGSLTDRVGEVTLPEALWLAGRIADGIRHGHRHGVAHLDIKPANVLLAQTDSGKWPYPKVSDWGLAKLLLEESNSIEGLSPTYAAPEQFDAATYGSPDDFTDIYQLGAVAYELVAGEPPFSGAATTVMRQVLDEEPSPPSTSNPAVPPAVDDVLLKALAKRKDDRYESILVFRNELDRLLTDHLEGGDIDRSDSRTTSGHEPVTGVQSTGSKSEELPGDGQSPETADGSDTSILTRRRVLGVLGVAAVGGSGYVTLTRTRNDWNGFASGTGRSGTPSPTSEDPPKSESAPLDTATQTTTPRNLPDFSALSDWPMVNQDSGNSGQNPAFEDPSSEGEGLAAQWTYETGGAIEGTPVVVDEYVIVGSRDFKVHAVTAARGTKAWTFQARDIIETTPLVYNGRVWVTPRNHGLKGLDLVSGDRDISLSGSDGIQSPPIARNDRIYYSSRDPGLAYCVDAPKDGQDWKGKLWEAKAGSAWPVGIGRNKVFVGRNNVDRGTLVALNKSDGSVAWRFVMDEEVRVQSPVVTGSTVFAWNSADPGILYAVDTELGEQRWKFADTGGVIYRCVTDGESIFVAHRYSISKIDISSGDKMWTVEYDGVVLDLALSSEWLYAGGWLRGVNRIDPDSGSTEMIWDQGKSSEPIMGISLANRQIYLTRDNQIISLGN